jgi:hypothetical protein
MIFLLGGLESEKTTLKLDTKSLKNGATTFAITTPKQLGWIARLRIMIY